MRIDVPLTEYEQKLLELFGYEISGPKTLYVCKDDRELQLIGKIPLLNQEGSHCFAKQKLKLPLQSLQYPLTWTEDAQRTALIYGPYQFHLTGVREKEIQKLKEELKNSIPIESREHLPSTIAKNNGYHYLLHSTRPENLYSILKDKELSPSRGKKGRLRGDPFGNDRFVFCTLLKGEDERNNILKLTGNTLPILVFRVDKVLDETKWHANTGHPLGLFSDFKTSDQKLYYSAHHSDPERFAKLLHNPSTEERNEIVFHQPVTLEHLERVYVKRGFKHEIVKVLNDRALESKIIEIDPLADSNFEFPDRLTPYSRNSHDKICYALSVNNYPISQFKVMVRSEYPELVNYCDQPQLAGETNHVEWFQSLLKLYRSCSKNKFRALSASR